ncbi:MAG: response regulator [Acidimicrobiales bacterium]
MDECASDVEVRPTVLVVDDDAHIRLLVTTVLIQAGFDVRASATGRAGLEMMRQGDVDVLLLDLHVPDLDAWSFLIRSWEDATVRRVPVVMFSASGDPQTAQRAVAWGCHTFLPKPFTTEELVDAVARAQGSVRI